ncbi:SET domain-containing protein SmydA-8-like isoform X2 [Anticarsia gemmatalis]|uniref:SET domain-containing protein SmydA-8-like isoform X2 n=1 Tax=Anticarsia gemmatalis TaxID=129554 RepID=UPI003F762888
MAHTPNQETLLLMEYLEDTSSKPLWIIKQSKLGGRGLFASQTIKKGSLIFDNKPLVIAPRSDCIGQTYCSVCFTIVDSCHQCHPCKKCSLIVCSQECKTTLKHEEECNFITSNWIPKTDCDNYVDVIPPVLNYLRFLLLTEKQKLLFSILQSCDYKCNIQELDNLCLKYMIPEDQVKFMRSAYSIMKINSFRISNRSEEKKIPLRGLYPLSAFMNHSCVPNTRNVFRNDNKMAVYATRDIEIGEELLTCYTGLLWSTPTRRCQLYKTKQFWCKCTRCEDNTEMGTNLSALKCFNKECVGVLLPMSAVEPATDWICDNCGSKTPASRISVIHSVLGSLVGSLDLDDQFRLDAPVLARLAKFVPYTNHIFIDIRLRLVLRLGFTEGRRLNELSESRLGLKESLCRGTLRTLAALGVGDAHLRGLLLYHLHAVLAERARRAPDLYEELKAEIENTIEQAYNILQGDISAPPDLELRRRYLGPGCDKPLEERFFILDS